MTRNNRLLLVLVVAFAAMSAFWFVALTPKREEAAALQDQITAKQAELEQARQEVVTYEAARASYPENYSTVARLGKAVPADDDIRSLMVQLDAAANRSGVDFESIDVGTGAPGPAPGAAAGTKAGTIPGVTENPAGFGTLPFTLAFKGSYFELSSFFSRLERFVTVSNRNVDATGRLLVLHSISLLPEADDSTTMRAQIGATSYLVPEGEGLTDGGTPEGPSAPATPAAGHAGGSSSPATPTTATVTGAVR